MAEPPRIVALVPMRHSSERVPGKNYRRLGDVPLFLHVLEALWACPLVSEVVIDTDSDTIREQATEGSGEVTFIDRPEELRGGHVPMTDVLTHDVASVAGDLFLQTHSTNPFLRSRTITDALSSFLGQRDRFDSLFSVTPLQKRLWTVGGEPMNHDPGVLMRTQDLEPVMEENSCLYLFEGELLARTGRRIGERPLLYPIAADEAWDIDDEVDWRIAEALHTKRQEESS